MQQRNITKALDNLDNAGYRLRCAREYMGLSEKEVADELKLMVSHVRAIEQNRSEYLVQRKPFERYLRAYAQLVQLNPDAIVDMYFAKSEPEPNHPVDITTRLEIPPQPLATRPIAGNSPFAGNNYYHPAVLGTGFVIIGLSLFAGWGVKQLVGSSHDTPMLVQNDRVEVRASARREQNDPAAAKPQLAAIRFQKPETSVPPPRRSELSAALQPIEVALKSRPVVEAPVDSLPATPSEPRAPRPAKTASQPVESIALQNLSVDVKQRPVIEPKPAIKQVIVEKTLVAAADAAPDLPPSDEVKTPASRKPQSKMVSGSAATKVADTKTSAAPKTTAPAARSVVAAKAVTAVADANKPALKFVSVGDAFKRERADGGSIDRARKQPLEGQADSESNPTRVALATTGQAVPAVLQPVTVASKQRVAPQPDKVAKTSPAENPQPALLANDPAPLSDRLVQDYDGEVDLGPGLQGEPADLDEVINDGVEQAPPFELALANSSDSASVARLALLESYKSTLRRRVYENVSYPGRAMRRNQEGKVVMNATVSRAGELLSLEMAEASRFGSLNRASEKAIKSSSPFPAAPDNLSGDEFLLTVPVVFKVPER